MLDPTRLSALHTRAQATLADPYAHPDAKAEVGDVLEVLAALEGAEKERDLKALRGGVEHVLRAAGKTEPSGEDWVSRVFNALGRLKRDLAIAEAARQVDRRLGDGSREDLERLWEERDRLRVALHLIAAEAQGQIAHGRTRREQEFGRRLVGIVDAVAPLGEEGASDA
jgi:hypothetical protein